MKLIVLQNSVSCEEIFPFLKSHVAHVMTRLKIYCGVSVSSSFLVVMWCFTNFFGSVAVFRAPKVPIITGNV